MPDPQTLALLLLAGLFFDAHSTWICLRRGHRETNPLLRRITPSGIWLATARLGLVLLVAFGATMLGARSALLPEHLRQHVVQTGFFVLTTVAITKLLAAFENYLLAFTGHNIASILFGGLRRKNSPWADMIVTLIVVILPAMALTWYLYPDLVW